MLAVTVFVHYLDRNNLAIVLPQIAREFGWDDRQIGQYGNLLLGAFYLTFGVAQVILIPIAKPKFTKKTAVDDPLLKVPPARRGNRVSALLAVPLAKRGEPKGGGRFVNSERATGIIPIAEPKFINPSASNPPSPRPSPPLTRGERAGSGGILHAQQFVNFDSTIGINGTQPALAHAHKHKGVN